jgi:hypothetical protein
MSFLSKLFPKKNEKEPDLLDMLVEEASHDIGKRSEFYRTLLASRLWVPGEARDGELFIRPYTIDGRKALLLFSSPERMAEGLRERPEFFGVTGRALLEAIPGFDSLILNYRTRTQKEFTSSEVAALLDGSIFEESNESCGVPRQIVLGQPKEYPVRLMEELKAKLPARSDVRAAYIAQLYEEGTMDAPRIVIAFETEMEEESFEVFRGRAMQLAEACDAGDPIFTRLEDDGLGEYLRKETEPFYKVDPAERID